MGATGKKAARSIATSPGTTVCHFLLRKSAQDISGFLADYVDTSWRGYGLALICDAKRARFCGVCRRRAECWAAMKHHSNMLDIGLVKGAATSIEARCPTMRDTLLLTLLLYTMVRSSEALAGEVSNELDAHAAPAPAASVLADPAVLARELAAAKPLSAAQFSPTEFRPRPKVQLESEASRGSFAMDEHLIGKIGRASCRER